MAIPYSALRAAKQAQQAPVDQPPEESTLSTLAGYALSPLAAVGNALDLIPSMGRDVLAGENPFDQWLHPLTDVDRTSGRELGTKWGLWGENDPNAWEAADFGGFGLEVALDPFSWLTPFGLTKAGTAAAKAGKLTPGLKAGIKAGERGLFGARVPFTDIGTAFGKGEAAQKAAGVVDSAIEGLAYGNIPKTNYSPGRHLSSMFDARVDGKYDADVQKSMRKASKAIVDEKAQISAKTLGIANALSKIPEASPDAVKNLMEFGHYTRDDAIKAMYEQGFDGTTAATFSGMTEDAARSTIIHDTLKRQRDMLEGVIDMDAGDTFTQLGFIANKEDRVLNQLAGLRADELDDLIQHFPRAMSVAGGNISDRAMPMAVRRSFTKRRGDEWTGFAGGTNRVNEIVTDDGIKSKIDEIAGMGGKTADQIEGVRDYIAEKFGHEISPEYHMRSDKGLLFESAAGKKLAKSRKDMKQGELVDAVGTPFEGQVEKVWHFPNAKKADTEYLKPVMGDRYQIIAKSLVKNPKITEEGLFHNDWVVDLHERLMANAERRHLANATYDVLSAKIGKETGSTNIGKLFDTLGIDRDNGFEAMLRRRGQDVDKIRNEMKPATFNKMKKAFFNATIGDETAKELTGLWPAFKVPEDIGRIQKGVASLNNLFKAGVLTWPARYVRDVTSGQMQNVLTGLVKPHELATHGYAAHKILQGQTVDSAVGVLNGVLHYPDIAKIVQESGLNPTDAEGATGIIRLIYSAYGPKGVNIQTDVVGDIPEFAPKTLGDLTSEQIGQRPTTVIQSAKEIGKQAVGIGEDGFQLGNLNPLNIRGFNGKTETTFGPVAAGDRIGKYTDDMNRLVPLMSQLKKGVHPSEAFNKINAAQVNYNPKTFTATERQLKMLFPFYSFTSRQLPFMVKTLALDPGGNIAQTIRASRLAHDPNSPDYVNSKLAIPLGVGEDGSKRYITGTGLMHEDPLAFFDGTVRGGLGELISRMSPLVKAPLEWASGESFFQRGPLGGRELEEMDPIVGRTASNLYEMATGEKQVRPMNVLPKSVEFMLANSPLSRGLTTVRQLTDPRKGAVAKSINALTGLRISDISPASEDATTREKAQAAYAELGAKNYTRYWMPEDALQSLSPTDQARARAYEALIKGLDARVKARSSEKKGKSGSKSRARKKEKV